MSKNFVSPPCNSGKISIDSPSNIYPSFSQGLPSSVPNANPRPPVFFVATGLRHVLNYSFQTGEEFALEFMQDKANTRKPSVPTISDERIIATSYVERREQPSVSEEKPHRKLLTCPLFNSTSSQGSCKKFPPEIYDSQPTRMKFLCNCGGRFLPRPSDGELRYVGGEKHLIRISRDMSWQGLISKTTKLIKRAHTIKYHLPGEEVNVLISVASDDDLHHMFDECTVLEESKERPVMYLFSDDNDEHHVHFFMGSSSDAETEAQFISLVNGLSGPGKALSTQDLGSASASNLDQLMFDIDDEGSLTGRTEEASTYIRSRPSQGIITVVSTESRAPLEKIPSSLQAQTANQDYATQNNEREVSSSSRRIRNFHNGSSVPSEFTNPAKWEQGDGKAVPRQQSELQRTVTNMTARGQRGTKDQDRQQSRRELLIPSDVCSLQTPSPCSNYTSPKPQTSSANKFPQFDNSSELQQLMAQELVGRSEYEMLASLSGDSKKLVCQHTSSDDTMMAPGGCSSQEDVLPYAATNPLSKNGNTQLLHSEVADPSYASRSNESGALISWHDDTYISMSPHTQDWPFVINSRQMQQPAAPDVMYSNANKKDHPSKPTGNDSETVPSPHPFISSDKKGIKLQTNSSVYSSGEKEQRSSSNGRQDAESSKITRSRSLPDGNSQQTRTPSQEVKGNGTPLIAELEVEESNSKPALPENSALGKGIISNVQIINNEDLEDLREMGSGAFGTVFHGRWKGTDVAIKRIKNNCFTYPSPERDKLIIEFWREAAILSKLHHPNVLAFYGIVNNGPGGTLATVTEFMVNGSLKKALLRKDKFLDRRKRIMLAMDAAIGMEYLHSKDIIHFDLKCDNLLVNLKDPSRPICKVADFGLSKMKQTTMVSGGMRGTLPWMAPELLTMSSSKVSDKVDVYSFGIVMWEILTGEEPYDGMHYGGVIGGILSNTLRPPVSNSCDPEWRRLMEQCWATDPELRPSFTEVAIRLRAILEASQSQPAS